MNRVNARTEIKQADAIMCDQLGRQRGSLSGVVREGLTGAGRGPPLGWDLNDEKELAMGMQCFKQRDE